MNENAMFIETESADWLGDLRTRQARTTRPIDLTAVRRACDAIAPPIKAAGRVVSAFDRANSERRPAGYQRRSLPGRNYREQ